MRRCTGFLFAGLLLIAAPGFAQVDQATWGVTGGLTPTWRMPGGLLESAFGAQKIDLHGQEFEIGLVRGRKNGGEWGVSLVRKRFSKDATVVLSGKSGQGSFTTTDAELLGFEVHRFFAFATIADKAQIGINVAGGVGQLRGFVDASYIPSNTADLRAAAPVRAVDIFDFIDKDITKLPLLKVELAVAALAGDRVKVRIGGGFNFPGFQVVSVTFSYLMGHDR